MSETYEVEATTQATSLDFILSDSSSDERSSDRGERSDRDLGSSSEPISALRAERERRKQKDKEFEALEREIQQFNDSKYGIDDESMQDYERLSGDPDRDAAVQNYEKSFNGFKTVHGEQRVAAIDDALRRLTPEQQQEVSSLVASPGDPVKNIEAYVQRLGLLDPKFQKLSLDDVLAGKKQEPAADTSGIDQRFAELSQREQAIELAERRTVMTASRTEFISDFGKNQLVEMDDVAGQFINSLPPAVAQQATAELGNAMRGPNAYHAAAALLSEWGVWAPNQQQQRPAPVMPSNFANARNVGPRRGPTWSGATPLSDIFDRKRPANG